MTTDQIDFTVAILLDTYFRRLEEAKQYKDTQSVESILQEIQFLLIRQGVTTPITN